MRKALLQLLLYAGYVLVVLGWFLANDANAITFLVGLNLGVALTGAFLAARKLHRPEKYQFVYEAEES
ncbi:hypothetical protein [Haloarchaeobius iranensis]|uniref:Uncharacterized protein n=1 Tax=Haloarchaeobius iranensis TaxID=996166 RepID=A0A1G9ZZR0_9EURY|nr:hypothetical protein [Haloarchaeobius iranensis]SDN26133.1 hypothetical protein SAMN05192554_12335 [Haloarchaeobius iranensis]